MTAWAEIGTAGRNRYVVLEYDANADELVVKWQKTNLDDGSERTGSTLFDFEGDGNNEVVYSEEAHLYVWRGTDGSELVKIPAEAGTRTEYPLVADINNDGFAEIVFTLQKGNGPGFSGDGSIAAYRSGISPWVSARQVWNQHGYFVTNINDDLTVPRVQQNQLHPSFNGALNGFLVQSTEILSNGEPAFESGDATINILSPVGLVQCPDVLAIEIEVSNMGDAEIPGNTPIAFYDGNPTTGTPTLLDVVTIGENVLPDTTITNIYNVTITGNLTPLDIYAVVNDPGFDMADLPYSFEDDFPATGTGECDFENNLHVITGVICEELCGDEFDNDGDGFADEPEIIRTADHRLLQ